MRAFVNGSGTTWGPVTCCVVDLGPALRCPWAQEIVNNLSLMLPVVVSGRNESYSLHGSEPLESSTTLSTKRYRYTLYERTNNNILALQPLDNLKLSLAPFHCSLSLQFRNLKQMFLWALYNGV